MYYLYSCFMYLVYITLNLRCRNLIITDAGENITECR